tara:strand:+ start:1168 stop:1740 length:573 start_codon:yes stop_codon:yes gene_type:complete
MDDKLVRLSKQLSFYLRHGLEKYKIPHDTDGFVDLSFLLKFKKFKGVTVDMVKVVVNNNSKKRFDIKTEDDVIYIRANQGHSSGKLNDNKMLEKINKPIEGCFHGTYQKNLESIKKNGLSRMKRKHIHIAESRSAISGQRSDCNLYVLINMKLAIKDGIKFYRSSNGVILTPGNSDGYLPSKYLSFEKTI